MSFNKIPLIGNEHSEETRNIINLMVQVINNRGIEILSDSAFLTWIEESGIKHLEEVQSFSDLPSNDSLNSVRGVLEDNKIYIKKENGWVPFQTIDISKINLVEENMQKRTDHIVNIREFEHLRVLMEDDYDYTPVFKAAIDAVGDGGEVFMPAMKVKLYSGIDVLKNITLKGTGFNSEIEVVDYGFRLGVKEPRKDVYASVLDIFFTGDKGTTRGNTSKIYGSQNEGLGFRTTNSIHAGTPNTSRGIIMEGVYTPSKISGCYFYDLDEGVKCEAQYGHLITNNKFWYCNIGIRTGRIVTTINMTNNTIERCAIGLYIGYASTKITVHDNVIEANYAGCDILIFNNGEDISIKRNYFEASPYNIVLRADSSGDFAPHKIYIEDNFGVELYARCDLSHVYLKNNNMNKVHFDIPVGTKIRNIVFEDNYEWSTREPYNYDNVTLNTEAMKYFDEIDFKESSNHRPSKNIDAVTTYQMMKQHKSFKKSANAAESQKGFHLEIPNESLSGTITIKTLKTRNSLANSPREILYKAAFKRTKDSNVLSDIKMIETHTFEGINNTPVADGTSPNTTFTGNATGQQTLNFNFINNSGGSSAEWFIDVEMLTSHSGVIIRP